MVQIYSTRKMSKVLVQLFVVGERLMRANILILVRPLKQGSDTPSTHLNSKATLLGKMNK